jgi:hypothetical protein
MRSQPPEKPVRGKSSTRASPEVRRRLARIAYFAVPFTVVSLVLQLLPFDSVAWQVAKTAFLFVGVIVLGVWVTRFSLWQRDEYWREQGRDPKHPERFPKRAGD